MTNKNYLRECYYGVVLDGGTIEKNRVTIHSIVSLGSITRYQVYSHRNKSDFFETYKDLDIALDKFLELSL